MRLFTLSCRLAALAVTGAALSVQAQTATPTSTKASCDLARANLETNLNKLRDVQNNLVRLNAIIRNYKDQRGSIQPENSGLFILDTVHDKAREHEVRIDELTYKAGQNRAEIKRCESALAS